MKKVRKEDRTKAKQKKAQFGGDLWSTGWRD